MPKLKCLYIMRFSIHFLLNTSNEVFVIIFTDLTDLW